MQGRSRYSFTEYRLLTFLTGEECRCIRKCPLQDVFFIRIMKKDIIFLRMRKEGRMFDILLVEDEKLELETLRDYVDWKKLGAGKVYTARNGRSALECMAEHEPDIMITDIQMPVMNGIELTRRVREEGYKCKIIFLSGYDDFAYLKSAFQVQAVDYILKPFSVEEVETLILRVRDEIEKERTAADSLKLASGQLLARVCAGREENTEEMSEKYFDRPAAERAYGMLAVYGAPKEELARSIAELAEVQHAFLMDRMIYVILYAYISFQDAAGRIAKLAGKETAVAWCAQKLSLAELEGAAGLLAGMREEIFYGRPGDVVCARPAEPAQQEMDRDAYHSARRRLRHCIVSGNEEEAKAAMQCCLEELKKADFRNCPREIYGLYLNLHNRLELEDSQLMREMDRREDKPELAILDAGFFVQAQEALWQYGKELCFFFKRQQEDPNYYVVNWVRDYIERNYGGVCSVEEMAEGLHLSPNYLRSLYKAGTGQTILEYLTDFRLQKACECLKDKTRKVKDVSLMVGYENVSYFSQVFVKRYGVTPNEYRKMV